MSATADLLIYADTVYVVTRQVDVCYLRWGWKESNEGDVAIRSGGAFINSFIDSLVN